MRFLNWGLPSTAALVVLLTLVLADSSPSGATTRALAPSSPATPAVHSDAGGGGLADAGPDPANDSEAPEEQSPSSDPSIVAPRHKPRSSLTFCDANIRVRASTTTCAFAQNVFYGYWLSQDDPGVFADSAGIPAYSPAAGATLDVSCSGASKIVCRTSDGGYVTFSMAAVSAYTMANAERYAATHELGDVPPPGDSLPDATEPVASANGGGCDPNYEGACLDPSAYDYDCAGGSGDGPEYTGPVEVVGSDPYDLDRDGDGVACAS